ncbi:hypothetical protein BDQ17DRAFT_1353616 [Cyathus striatus]|nr:hypothetical protein BDQ17DRAFT_1353616 [Cyathus striatus]
MEKQPLQPFFNSSPINFLPDEILIEICQLYLGLGWDESGPSALQASNVTARYSTSWTPVLLTHVCRAWRKLISSTPTMWSSIAIHNPRLKFIPLVRLWLQCAGKSLLSISLRHGPGWVYRDPQTEPATIAVLKLLNNRSHLWKSIDFNIQNVLPPLTNIPTGSLHVLEHASIYIVSTMHQTPSDNMWAIIHSSPRISSVQWHTRFNIFQNTPWEQLKSIKCSFSVPIDEFLHSLQFCRNLEVLDWTCWSEDEFDILVPPSPTTSVLFPALKKLQLEGFEGVFDKLLGAINVPQITTLTLDHIVSKCLQAFRDFMACSRCTLESFLLSSPDILAMDLFNWLEIPGLSLATDVNIFLYAESRYNFDFDSDLEPEPNQSYMDAVVAEVKKFITENSKSQSIEEQI